MLAVSHFWTPLFSKAHAVFLLNKCSAGTETCLKLAGFECKSWFYPLQYKTTNEFLSTHHSTPLFINFNKTCMFFIWLEPCRLCHIWELSKLKLILDPSCYHRVCLPVASSVINIGALRVMHADAQVFEAWVLAKKLWHVFHTAILK